jgi:hypothetical protein
MRSKRAYLFYRASDFSFYLFSLAVSGALAWWAYPYVWARTIYACALLFMAITFVLKHGIELELQTFADVARGLLFYPRELVGKLWSRRLLVVIALTSYGIAIAIEKLLLPRLVAPDNLLLRTFPAAYTLTLSFGVLNGFRAVVLVAHLYRAKEVKQVLADSGWRRELKGHGVSTHLIQAYFTGFLAQANYFIPAALFWRLFPPTVGREVILFLAAALLNFPIFRLTFRLLKNLDPRLGMRFSAWHRWIMTAGAAMAFLEKTYVREHEAHHRSRFHFTVFHGHHHDAVPCALIGGPGHGLLEALEAGFLISTSSFLMSAIFTQVQLTVAFLGDMLAHQYIAGIFPGTRFVLGVQTHHVAHHFGSLRPLSLVGIYKTDVAEGYVPNNSKTRWFVDTVRNREPLSDEFYDDFLRLAAVTAATPGGSIGAALKNAGRSSAPAAE